jgi:uncharacterized SAM-binding protein YcdF (DUF218 family)
MYETWSYSWAIRNIIAELLMPPGLWILMAGIVLIAFQRRKKLQTIALFLPLLMLWITSTTVFSQQFSRFADNYLHWPAPVQLEDIKSAVQQSKQEAIAIVILGSGVRRGALDNGQYQNQDVSKEAMERMRMGARLAKITHRPILVTGGSPDRSRQEDLSEGQLMAKVLHDELGVKVTWIEQQSNTTQENATYSAEILGKEGIQTIYLVTHYWHMPRSQTIFEKQGLKVHPIPVGFNQLEHFTPLDYLPSNQGFALTRQIWHELLGQVWYLIKF